MLRQRLLLGRHGGWLEHVYSVEPTKRPEFESVKRRLNR